ncbi:MAG: hypothetical protein EOO98_00845 [Pedobacter sp.]|nr:MAG: hypothetical protein EOO98_00845 [Pedobacter sp.]
MKIKILSALIITLLFNCGKTSSPDGRAQLRDQALAEKIEKLEQKQIVILDSLQLLDKKMKVISAK